MSLVLLSLVLPSWITTVKISISGHMYVTSVTVTGVTFFMDNYSEDQYIRSYVCHWCYLLHGYLQWRSVYQVICMSPVLPSLWITTVKISISGHMFLLVLPSLWITTVKISISGHMYVTGVTFMDNNSEDQYIRSYVCHWCYCHWCYLLHG